MNCSRCGIKMLDDEEVCSRCGFKRGGQVNNRLIEEDDETPAEKPIISYYAGFWERFAAILLDLLIVITIQLIFVGIFGGTIFGVSAIGRRFLDFSTIRGFMGGFGLVLAIVFSWLYFTLFESSARRATLGKLVMGIVVISETGARITFAQANIRYWGKTVSALILMAGFIMAGFNARKQALHDLMAATLVVNNGAERTRNA